MKSNKKYTYFVGIDISKLTLDFSLLRNKSLVQQNCIGNNVVEIKELIMQYRAIDGLTLTNTVFGMESTGIYTNPLKEALSKLRANIVIESGLYIKNSLGNIRGKTDKIDSERIALYLYKSRDMLQLWQPRRPIIEQLASLSTLRSRMLALQISMGTPLKESLGFVKTGFIATNNSLCSRSVEAIKGRYKGN